MLGERHMTQFHKGDVVRLKSGGPWMTITALGDYSGWTMRPTDTASCRWFEGKKKQETVFDVALLEKASGHVSHQEPAMRRHRHLAHSRPPPVGGSAPASAVMAAL